LATITNGNQQKLPVAADTDGRCLHSSIANVACILDPLPEIEKNKLDGKFILAPFLKQAPASEFAIVLPVHFHGSFSFM
jgi:hypothetical protein